MQADAVAIMELSELQQHVRAVLCTHDRLNQAEASLRQAWLMKNGRRCGLFFQVQGPRLLRTYAVWSAAEQRVLYYESTGTRFAETRLTEGPNLAALAER